MRTLMLFIATVALVAGPAFAQTTPERAEQAQRPSSSQRKPSHLAYAQHRTHTGERPVDVGPYTPEANRAYQGGGVILQGAPGAPAPTPQATPPGQMPLDAVLLVR